MLFNKKIIIYFLVFIIIVTCLSGCILKNIFNTTNFSLNSYRIVDDQGFPALSIYFNCSNRVNFKTYDTNLNLIDYDFFYHEGNTTLNIGNYKETVKPGKYSFKVYDINNNELFSKNLNFIGSNLSIRRCEQQWWEYKNKYILIGLKIYVQNFGDIPVYPYYADMIVDSQIYTGDIVSSVILPGLSEYIYFNFIHKGIFNDDSFEIILKDKNNITLSKNSFNFDIRKNISTKYYFKGLDKTIAVPYPDFLYNYYSNLDRIIVENYSVYILDRYDDIYLNLFLDIIIESFSDGLFNLISDVEKIEYINGFVQALEYKLDSTVNDSYEYPRFPIETLFNENGGGDCEDKSILTASLLEKLGYKVALFRLPKHMAVGVKLDKETVPKYNFYTDNYFFLETTNEGKPLGFIPKEYKSPTELYVYPIKQTEFITHNWKNSIVTIYSNTESGNFVKVIAFIENLGNENAKDIKLKGLFYNNQDYVLISESIVVGDIPAFEKKKIILSIQKPSYIDIWFETRVIINSKVVDIQKSSYKFD